jgi:hypothetical protein
MTTINFYIFIGNGVRNIFVHNAVISLSSTFVKNNLQRGGEFLTAL